MRKPLAYRNSTLRTKLLIWTNQRLIAGPQQSLEGTIVRANPWPRYILSVPGRAFALLLLLLCVTAGATDRNTTSLSVAPPTADVIVIHDSLRGQLSSGIIVGNNILDLLGHFGLKGILVPLEEYKAGDINRFRFAFILGVDDRNVTYPAQLLADVRNSQRPVFWINRHLNDLLADKQFESRIGIHLRPGVLKGVDSVSYKGKSLLKPDESLYGLDILDNTKVQVLATAEDKNKVSNPYVVRSGSFWYCADSPFAYTVEGDRYWVFCDLLHDFFNMPHQQERKALIRIEDVSVEDDLDELHDLADYLYSRHVPFQISLIPIFKDPATNTEIYLSDRPQFVRTIRYMVSKGGLVVMHGVTHQYRGRSADDYEFWDEIANKPVTGDSQVFVEQRLRLGLEECFKNGIYPVTWETPHYMASILDYQVFATYFNSAYDRNPSANDGDSGHVFPYPTTDRWGRFIIPESLGYISLENPNPGLLVANADRLLAVRDGVASFFFHPFIEREHLTKILDGLEGQGYQFISIGSYDCRVQMDDKLAQTFTETIRLPIHGHYLHRLLVHDDGRISSESYSERPLDTVIRDPGVVPPDAILVMEGVDQIASQKEIPPPGMWETFRSWLRQKLARQTAGAPVLTQPRVLVLWEDTLPRADWNDQNAYVNALSAFGFQVTTPRWKDFSTSSLDPETILVVPRGAGQKLTPRQIGSIVSFVRDGGSLVLGAPSRLSQLLGVHTEKRVLSVTSVEDMLYGNAAYATQDATWNPPAEVHRFTVDNQLAVYARDKESELPMAVLATFGRGRFIYLAARLDSVSPLGYTRLPYFVHYVRSGFNVRLPLQRGQIELYFDPGLTKGKDIDRLAQEWRKEGVRAIYAAAYQFWPAWSYNYAHLIDVCHRNGILVYAWFELPHVSMKFWEDHPEWRAKTATGADGNVGWRYHMDLDIPECQDAAFGFAEDLLKQYAWDGVNIAELNYDTDNGPENPKSYLPMGASTRSAFRALGGFDPILLFAPDSPYYWKTNPAALKKFEEYRTQRVFAWHRAVLERLTPLAQERDIEIIVTMLDSLHSRTLNRDTGVDSHLIVALMDKFPFTLQVEDPSQFWIASPDRYRKFGETYLNLVRDPKRLMFDINVVSNRDIKGSSSPTPTACGIELAESLVAAGGRRGRAAIYSEATIPFEDLELLSRVLAKDARVERRWNSWVTQSTRSMLMTAPGQWQHFRIDDQLWPGWGENEVFIPAGTHRITAVEKKFSLLDTSALDLRLLRFTGNLTSLAPTKRGLEFNYDSSMRTLALFTREPFAIRIDGQPSVEKPVSYYGLWSARFPRGRHHVEVVADSTASIILDTTSLYSSSLIVIFGGVACGLMLLLYLAILARRALGRAVGKTSSTRYSNS